MENVFAVRTAFFVAQFQRHRCECVRVFSPNCFEENTLALTFSKLIQRVLLEEPPQQVAVDERQCLGVKGG